MARRRFRLPFPKNKGGIKTPLFDLTASFLVFLEVIAGGAEIWEAYRQKYLEPNRTFLEAYFHECLGWEEKDIKSAVKRFTAKDYRFLWEKDYLESLAGEAGRILSRCREISPVYPEAPVCIFVGFFSPPAFIIFPGGRPAIGLALERRPEVGEAGLLIAHEYGHYLVSLILGRRKPWEPGQSAERMLSEGLAVHFSKLALPRLPGHQAFFLTRKRVGECRRLAEDILGAGRDKGVTSYGLTRFFIRQPVFPKGCRTYLAYRFLEKILRVGDAGEFEDLVRQTFRLLT